MSATLQAPGISAVSQADARAGSNNKRLKRAASVPTRTDGQIDLAAHCTPDYLGSTSFTAVFAEDLGSLEVEPADVSDSPANSLVPVLAADKLALGCRALAILQNQALIVYFVGKTQEYMEANAEVIICPMMVQWIDELFREHGSSLRNQDTNGLRRLCEQLWINTRKPLVFDGSISPKQWTSLSSGRNIRWEVIGAILANVGLAARGISPLEDIFQHFGTTRDQLSHGMHDAALICLEFCRDCDVKEDVFQWFLNDLNNLTGAIKGPDSYRCYCQTGELINAVIATGFQKEIKADSRTPLFLAELRKRSRASCYGQEVALASLLGRPPRLSHRYTKLDLPLDLSDSNLFHEPSELDEVISKLDHRGWSEGPYWGRVTYIRGSLLNSSQREDAIDLSLGNYSREEILSRVMQIRQKHEHVWAGAPDFVRVARDSPSQRTTPMLTALYHNVIRHGYLGNELLLQQVLMRKTGAPSDQLIDVARLIFKDMMSITGRPDIQKGFCMDLTWLLASQGLRCGAILAVELYKQEQMQAYPAAPRLPRAETIRELSIFVERLSELDRNDGLFAFCDQGRRLISCVLDQILAPPQQHGSVSNTAVPNTSHLLQMEQHLVDPAVGDFGSMDFAGLGGSIDLGNDAEFMQWLDFGFREQETF